jgi:uncharacterized protein involved in oxidation of intracellular sulfur
VKILFILNEAPYGSEKTYNALRLAMALQKDQAGTEVRIFLMADAVTAAISAQGTPQGYYNIERMLKAVVAKGGHVKLCGTCCEARGMNPDFAGVAPVPARRRGSPGWAAVRAAKSGWMAVVGEEKSAC